MARHALTLLCIAVFMSARPAAGADWRPPSSCSSECSANHTCMSCREGVVGECAAGEVADLLAQRQEVDRESCMQTDCTTGGCPLERPVEVQSEPCLNLHLDECRTGVCMRETCCRQHAINRCCRELPCIQQFQDCQVSEQLSSNASVSSVNTTRLPHGAKGIFPFYTNRTVLAGQSCVKVWGRCSCNDGQLLPGCDPSNSSSWATLEADAEQLPPGLHQTCTSLEGCRMPQRVDPLDPSNASITYVAVQHNSTAMFPFFTAETVLPGQACEQVLGSCSCDNGRLLPGGCDPSASSTWWGALGGNATSPQQPLPPGLFLTCGVNASHAGQDAHRQLTGAQVAGIAVACAFVAALLLGVGLWYLRSRLSLKRWSQLRLGSSYQPVLTGTTPERPGAPSSSSVFGTMGEALGKFRSGVGLGRKGREGWSAAQQQEGGRYGGVGQPMPRHLPYPASTDDEVFTLDDLDSNHQDHYPMLPVSRRAEVELHTHSTHSTRNSATQRHTHTHGGAADTRGEEGGDKQPLLPASVVPTTPPRATSSQASHGGSAGAARRLQLAEEEAEGEEGGGDEESGPLVGGGGGRHRRR